MKTDEEFFQEIAAALRSDIPRAIIGALWPFEPRLGRGAREKEPLTPLEERLIPEIERLLDDRRLCCLTVIAEGLSQRYYGEVRWYVATVLAEFYARRQSNESLILRDVLQPFTKSNAYQIAKDNKLINPTSSETDMALYDTLREKGLLRMFSEIDLGGAGLRGVLFITGWVK